MSSKVAVITGANSGIGKETAKALAKQGVIVVMGCRDAERAESARQEIMSESGSSNVVVIPLDLASLQSVRNFAAQFQQQHKHLDLLINNAGLFPFKKQMTEDGFETQFGVNHLGHFLLTHLLMPQLQNAERARVINVASMIHHLGKVDFDSFRGEKRYSPLAAYGQSKLANVLFTRELAQRCKGTNVTAYCLHPGAVGTNIAGRSPVRRTLYKLLGGYLSPARGAKTSIYLATEPGIESSSGSYYDEHCKVKPGSKRSRDTALAERLWKVSEQLLGLAQPVS